MFSARFHWDLRPNRLTTLLLEKRRAGAEILDLTESNPTHAGLEYPPVVIEALADPRALCYDPEPAGALSAREAVCRYYADAGYSVDPARVLLTASTSEAYAYLFKLLADPGDEVLVPRPSYPLFEYLATMESLRVVTYSLVYHGAWSIDTDALRDAITPRSRAIVVVNPNNPTGSFLKQDELAFLLRLCREHNLALISDEVFADYAFAPDPNRVRSVVPAPSRSRLRLDACDPGANASEPGASASGPLDDVLAFAMSGLSKIAGLPQMKLGWIVIAGPSVVAGEAAEKLEWIADTYLSVSTPVQVATPVLFDAGKTIQTRIAARVRANLDCLRSTLAGSPCHLLRLEGGWYAVLQVPRIRREEEWGIDLLQEDNVLLQPGFFYDFPSEAFLVASLLTRADVFQEGCRRLLRRVVSST